MIISGEYLDANSLPSVSLYKQWVPFFDAFSDEERGILLKWILWYAFEKATPKAPPHDDERMEKLYGVFLTIRKDIDKQFLRWQQYIEKRSR